MAGSFDSAAELYERARPSYPQQAVDWLLESAPRRVLDLGAGTGKLTRLMAGRVDVLYAVDPSPNMLAQLADAVPQAIIAVGAAEAIPLPDGSVDAVLVAQAWHWVDPARALPAVRRVLAPRGVLGLIWNVRDESVPWVAELTRIIHGSEAERFVANDQPLPTELGPIERLGVRWERPFDRQSLLELVGSRSYVISAPPDERAAIMRGVDDLLDNHPALQDEANWRLPYRTEAFRIRLA